MIGLWQIVVLAFVQGLTEFLPISSSGHLVLVGRLLGVSEATGEVNIVLHLGTLGSVLAVYFRRVVRLLGQDRRAAGLLAVATLPAVVVGLPVKLLFEGLLESVALTGFLLIVTGVILWWSPRGSANSRSNDSGTAYTNLRWSQALWMGLAQAAAIMPGLSRSGTTITTGLWLGLPPRSAATFSFLMALPVIAGAGVLQLAQLAASSLEAAASEQGVESAGSAPDLASQWPALLTGLLVSFAVGWVALRWVLGWLERGRFHWFAWWCFPLGVATLVWAAFDWLAGSG